MSGTRNSRAFSNVQLESLRYQRTAIPAAGGVMAVDGDGQVSVTSNVTLGTISVTGHASLNTVTSELEIVNRLRATGATITNLAATNATVSGGLTAAGNLSVGGSVSAGGSLTVGGIATIPTIIVKDIAITDLLVLPTTIAQPVGTTVICAPQILAGTTYNVPFLSRYALDVSGSANISKGLTVTDLTVTNQINLPIDVAIDNLLVADIYGKHILAGSEIPVPNPYALNVVGKAVFEEGVTMYGNLDAVGITVNMLSGVTANIGTLNITNTGFIQNLVVGATTQSGSLGVTGQASVGSLSVGTGATIGTLSVTNGTTLNGLNVTGFGVFGAGASVGGGLTADSLVVTGAGSVGSLTVGTSTQTGSLYVVNGTSLGSLSVTNGTTLNGLTVTGFGVFSAGASVGGGVTADSLVVTGAGSIGSLTVGATTQTGTLGVTGLASLGSLNVTNGTTLNGLAVTGFGVFSAGASVGGGVTADFGTIGSLTVTTGATVGSLRALSSVSLPGGITLDNTGLIQAPSAIIQNFEVTNQFVVDIGAQVIIPTSYHTAVLANKMIAGTTFVGALLTDNYAMDVSGALLVTQGATVTGLLVGLSGLTTTAGYFSDTVTVARGIAGTTATLSGNVTIGGGLTVTGLLVGSGGLTATTGYFSDGVTVAKGVGVLGDVTIAGGLTVSGRIVGSSGLTTTTGYFSDTVTVAKGIAGTTATLSGNVTIGGGLTTSGLLVAAGGLTATTGYFSDTVTVAKGIGFLGDVTIAGGLTVSGRLVGSSGLTTTTGYFSDTVTVARGIAGTTATLSGNVTIGGGLTTSGLLVAAGGLTATTGYFSDTVTVAKGIAGTTANFTGNATVGGDLTVTNSVVALKGVSGVTAVFTNGMSTNTIQSYNGTVITIQPTGANAGIILGNDANKTTGQVISYPLMSMRNGAYVTGDYGIQLAQTTGALTTPAGGTGGAIGYNVVESTSGNLEVVVGRGGYATGGGFNIWNTANATATAANSKIFALDNTGSLTLTGSLTTSKGVAGVTAVFTTGMSTNTIQSYNGTIVTIQPTGSIGIILGNSANKTTGQVISYPLMSMRNGAYVEGNYGIQLAQTTGTLTTPGSGNGGAIGYNVVESTSGNLEVVVGRGGYATGGGFNIWNTADATATSANSKIFALDNTGTLTLTGPLKAYQPGSPSVIAAPNYAWRYVMRQNPVGTQYDSVYASIQLWYDAWFGPASNNFSANGYVAPLTGYYLLTATVRMNDASLPTGIFFGDPINTNPPNSNVSYSSQGIDGANQNSKVTSNGIITTGTETTLTFTSSDFSGRKTASMSQIVRLNVGDRVTVSLVSPSTPVVIAAATFSGHLVCAL